MSKNKSDNPVNVMFREWRQLQPNQEAIAPSALQRQWGKVVQDISRGYAVKIGRYGNHMIGAAVPADVFEEIQTQQQSMGQNEPVLTWSASDFKKKHQEASKLLQSGISLLLKDKKGETEMVIASGMLVRTVIAKAPDKTVHHNRDEDGFVDSALLEDWRL